MFYLVLFTERDRIEACEILASANDVSSGCLFCASKWEPSLELGDHDEHLCWKPSLLGVFGDLASKYSRPVLTFHPSLVTGVSLEGAFCDLERS